VTRGGFTLTLVTNPPGSQGHRINVLVRAPSDGVGVWLDVGVCPRCQPGVTVRRTFSAGEPCPQCGADGELEWRWWPKPLARVDSGLAPWAALPAVADFRDALTSVIPSERTTS